jgi:hypothetical protein
LVKNRRSFLATVASGSAGLSLVMLDPAAALLNPKKKPLANGDEPAVHFAVTGGEG